jgi:hypothetical protein
VVEDITTSTIIDQQQQVEENEPMLYIYATIAVAFGARGCEAADLQ